MAATHPLPLPGDDLDVQLVTPELLATLSPEERALWEETDRRHAESRARVVWQEDVPAALEEIRRMKGG
jgi:hypothetical protein